MPPTIKAGGIESAGAQLVVVRSTVGIVLRALVVLMATFYAVDFLLDWLGAGEGALRELYEIGLTCILGLPILFQSTLRPMARMAAKQAASGAETLFRTVAQAVHDGIVIHDATGKIRFANVAAERMHGYKAGSLQGKPLESLLPEDRRQEFRDNLDSFLRDGQSPVIGKGAMELLGMNAAGEAFPIEITVNDLKANDETLFVAVVRDISARKQAEHEIQARTLRLDALLANSPMAVVVLDKNRRMEMCNPAFEQLFQYSSAEIVGQELDTLVANKEQQEEASHLTEQVMQGGESHAISRRRRKDGSVVDVEIHGVPLLIEGELEGSYAIYQDISDRKRLQLYEQMLPVCCVCGKIRDDAGTAPGKGIWDRLDLFISRHSDAKLSHTFCPTCLEQYRKDQGI
jgi:PAS domain S-box-containing protein